MASNILKIEGAVNKSHLLPGPNRRFYSERRDHLDPGTNVKYEIISAQINNDIIFNQNIMKSNQTIEYRVVY